MPPYKETANQLSAYNTDTFTYNANAQRWSQYTEYV